MTHKARLRDLLEAWNDGTARGKAPDPRELCRDCPELLTPLLELIQSRRTDSTPGNSPQAFTPGETTSHSQEAPSANTHSWGHPSSAKDSSRSLDNGPIPPLPPGDVPSRFELRTLLGEGGFGSVYQAWDNQLHRKVALKVLKPSALSRRGARENFLAEARAMAAIQHDHVMPILHFGEDSGRMVIAMPLLGGETLGARLERDGALPNEEIARIGREIASGLSAIHAKGYLHRDLKPSNIWLEAGTGRVKVIDFGLAHDPLDPVESHSGTPIFMSPEQAACRELDARSDIFSLGSVLYNCATGRFPFSGTTMREVLDAVGNQEPANLTRMNPGISPQLIELIRHLLQKDPDLRPASAREVVERLSQPMAQGSPTTAKTSGSSRWPLWLTGAALVALALGIGAYSLFGYRKAEPGPVPPVVPVEKLLVKSLEVRHYAGVNDKKTQPKGVIGKESFDIHLEDEIEVKALLNRPGYCYLIIFRPDGKDAVLYPQDDTDVPELTETVTYPSKRTKERYWLEKEEKPGLWLVAAFVSETPLPSYREWRKNLAGNPWKPVPNPEKNLVSMYDGFIVETKSHPADRGSKESRDKSPVNEMMDWLKSKGASTARAVAFPVEP